MTGHVDARVIVIGAGPCGLTVAIELGRRGIRTIAAPRNAAVLCSFGVSCATLSGHCKIDVQCPLLGVKRTCRLHCEMSAYDPKRTSSSSAPNFRRAR
jgi:heterodisulfide reductase subunit A-like polyferredoxin